MDPPFPRACSGVRERWLGVYGKEAMGVCRKNAKGKVERGVRRGDKGFQPACSDHAGLKFRLNATLFGQPERQAPILWAKITALCPLQLLNHGPSRRLVLKAHEA